MLITAQERERSRLALEIHDDFSQRLALIALELENAEEAIGRSPDEAAQQVRNILNSASELSADLHTLSHRLHSSTLERLGLVPGVTALCREFAAQQGIEIDFLSDNVPSSVHPDVALCSFRIVQEGLRNLKKHSGASKGQVRLRKAGDKLLVSVYDEGIGFDARIWAKKRAWAYAAWKNARTCWAGGPRFIRSLGRGQESKPPSLSSRNPSWRRDDLESNGFRLEQSQTEKAGRSRTSTVRHGCGSLVTRILRMMGAWMLRWES